jgi:hypothetical protein
VRIELVDEQECPFVRIPLGVEFAVEPARGCAQRARAGKVGFVAKPRAIGFVRALDCGRSCDRERGRADRGRIRSRVPRVILVTAQVLPRVEVGVVVLAAALEEMRMIADEHGRHAGSLPQEMGDRVFPDLDRSPWLPREVQSADKQIVPGRDTRQ